MLQKLLENINVLIESNDRWRIERDDIRRRIGIVLDEIKESGYKCNAPRMRDPQTNKILPRTEKEKRNRRVVPQLFLLLNIMDRPALYEIEKYAVILRSKVNEFDEMDDTLKNRRYIRDELVEVYCELERLIKTVDDTKNRLFANIMLYNGERFAELHMGGIVSFDALTKKPEFWNYLKENLGKSITVELYAYCLYGNSGVTRNATTEEVEKIIDDEFPHSPEYAKDLQGEDNESNPFGYTVKPYKHNDDSAEVFAVYKPNGTAATGDVLLEYECLSDEESQSESSTSITQSM